MRNSYNFLNTLIPANSMSWHSIDGSFIVLNVVIVFNFFFSDILVAEHGIYDHDLRKKVKILVKILFLFSVLVFNMINLLVILQVKVGKTVIKEFQIVTKNSNYI